MAPSSPDGFILRHDDSPMEATVNEIRPAHWRALWISDIHLGTAGSKAEFLLDFLEHNDSDTLYRWGHRRRLAAAQALALAARATT